VQGGEENGLAGGASTPWSKPGRAQIKIGSACSAASALAVLMLTLVIPLAHLAFLTGDPADGAVSEEALIARIREQFGFLGAGVTVTICDGSAHISLPPAATAKADEATKLYERAGKRAREGDFARAVELYQRVLTLNPALPSAHRDLAMSLMELGRTAEAKDALIDALRLAPDDAWSFVVLGNLYAQQPDGLARARTFFERALELKPADAWALNGLATMLARAGDTAAALARFDEAIAAHPDFPNAWHGKALTLSRNGEATAAADTLSAMFRRTMVPDARSEPVFAEASRLFLSVETTLAQRGESDAFKAVEDYRRTIERESGYPIEIVEEKLSGGIAGRAQMAWKHGRDRHVVTVRKPSQPLAPPLTSHLVAHELTHIRLETEARRVGRNRFFATTAATHARAMQSLAPDLRRLEQQRHRPDAVERMVTDFVAGTCGLLFNSPLDMLIERRLAFEMPALRPVQLLSLVQLATEARTATLNPEIRKMTPQRILRAASACIGAHALFLDDLSGGATRCWAPYRRLESAELSEKLWRHWQQRQPALTPGDEYDLVDEFADLVGLRDWYVWQPDPGDQQPAADDVVREGTSNPELLRAKHPAAVWFLLNALKRYARLADADVRQIALEAALLGQEGLDYASPEKKYTLRALPGETFSGLELMCLMHAGFKRLAPGEDTGMNLDEPFLTALELFNGQPRPS
jgi:tetratricopeptide (TPR) repeat protein